MDPDVHSHGEPQLQHELMVDAVRPNRARFSQRRGRLRPGLLGRSEFVDEDLQSLQDEQQNLLPSRPRAPAVGNGLRRRYLGFLHPQVFGVLAVGQEDVQVVGEIVDFLRCELVAAVVSEVGEAPHAHRVPEVDQQESRALRLAAHPSSMKPRHQSLSSL